jgi:hypothetical protein
LSSLVYHIIYFAIQKHATFLVPYYSEMSLTNFSMSLLHQIGGIVRTILGRSDTSFQQKRSNKDRKLKSLGSIMSRSQIDLRELKDRINSDKGPA